MKLDILQGPAEFQKWVNESHLMLVQTLILCWSKLGLSEQPMQFSETRPVHVSARGWSFYKKPSLETFSLTFFFFLSICYFTL